MSDEGGAVVGRRERKKRDRSAAIRAAAMRLFERHGFDEVTISDIAAAADVSEQTVYNHFPTKEALVFATNRGAENRAGRIEGIHARAPGEPLSAPFRRLTMEALDELVAGPVDDMASVFRIVGESRQLLATLTVSWEAEAAELADAIAAEVGARSDDELPWIVGHALAWTNRAIFRAAYRRLAAGADPEAIAASLRAEATRAYDLLDGGLAAYGAKPG